MIAKGRKAKMAAKIVLTGSDDSDDSDAESSRAAKRRKADTAPPAKPATTTKPTAGGGGGLGLGSAEDLFASTGRSAELVQKGEAFEVAGWDRREQEAKAREQMQSAAQTVAVDFIVRPPNPNSCCYCANLCAQAWEDRS